MHSKTKLSLDIIIKSDNIKPMNIREYQTGRGISPFRKWYKKLDNTLKGKVDARLQRASITSNLGDVRNVGNGVSEMRFHARSGLRIYFSHDGDNLILLLLLGGNKSSQDNDIEKAKTYWKNYTDRGK